MTHRPTIRSCLALSVSVSYSQRAAAGGSPPKKTLAREGRTRHRVTDKNNDAARAHPRPQYSSRPEQPVEETKPSRAAERGS